MPFKIYFKLPRELSEEAVNKFLLEHGDISQLSLYLYKKRVE